MGVFNVVEAVLARVPDVEPELDDRLQIVCRTKAIVTCKFVEFVDKYESAANSRTE